MASPTASPVNREWISAEFSKGVSAEQEMAADAKVRAESPPDPTLAVLYHEIASADERHAASVETIAIRYGHTPSRTTSGGIGETLGRLKDKVADTVLRASPLEHLGQDLARKANAIHWYTAWIYTFGAIGDAESARELASLQTEEKAHHDALQEGLNRLVEQGARSEPAPAKAK